MTASKKVSRHSLALETLEDRLAPAVAVNVTPAKDLLIVSNGASDQVVVSQVGAFYRVSNFGAVVAMVHVGRITGGDLIFHGNAGNDYLRNDTALRTWAFGGLGNDILIGGSSNDQLWGQQGNDRLFGRGGNDVLRGGTGDDRMYGGTGNDTFWGDAGRDVMIGEAGNDVFHGGTEEDWAFGGLGFDFAFPDVEHVM